MDDKVEWQKFIDGIEERLGEELEEDEGGEDNPAGYAKLLHRVSSCGKKGCVICLLGRRKVYAKGRNHDEHGDDYRKVSLDDGGPVRKDIHGNMYFTATVHHKTR